MFVHWATAILMLNAVTVCWATSCKSDFTVLSCLGLQRVIFWHVYVLPLAFCFNILPTDSSRHHDGYNLGTCYLYTCGRGMWKGGGECTIHPSRRWLISCARTTVLCVCLSVALMSCTTSMAETNVDAIRKQKNVEYCKRYRLKWKLKKQV